MSQPDREPAGDASERVWAAWANARGIKTLAKRAAEQLPAADPNIEQEYLAMARVFRHVVSVGGHDAEDLSRFLRRASHMFAVNRQNKRNPLARKMARLYIQAAECLEAGEPVELDAGDLDARERRNAADVLAASARRAMHDLDVQAPALNALQSLAFAFDRFAGPDPVRDAHERALWRRDAAWEPYSSAEPFRAFPRRRR